MLALAEELAALSLAIYRTVNIKHGPTNKGIKLPQCIWRLCSSLTCEYSRRDSENQLSVQLKLKHLCTVCDDISHRTLPSTGQKWYKHTVVTEAFFFFGLFIYLFILRM